MRFLFIHQNFPGQYRHIAAHYGREGHEVVGIGENPNLRRNKPQIPGVRVLGYDLPPLKVEGSHAHIARAVHRGQRVAQGAAQLRRTGFVPDVIFAHIGWGEALFLKDVFPEATIILYCEFFYRAKGGDLGFDPEFPATPEKILRLRVMNAPLLMALDACDAGMAPTRWQHHQFPACHKPRIATIHDGIDTDVVCPRGEPEEELITYVSRNLEPYRGFHTFMRAIPEIQRRRPKARIVIVGGDEVSYSPRLQAGQTYRGLMLKELEGRIDLGRVQFLGKIPYQDYLSVLRRSSVHVYFTYPFVLSWSLLESMAAGCMVVGSRTPPVEEAIREGENGLLCDFFCADDIADKVDQALSIDQRPLRAAARRTVVERYDLKRVCLPAQVRLVERLIDKNTQLQGQRADARPAADVQHLPGDEARGAVGEEQHRARDIVGLA